METVKIRHCTDGDSRYADHVPTITEFDHANVWHREDVGHLIERFCHMLKVSTNDHDWTKVREPLRSQFYCDMVSAMHGDAAFEDGKFAKAHYEQERHHLNRHVPDDVNLFDVVEMVCDCVAAGMARSGDVYPIKIEPEVFNRAINNTVELLKKEIEVVDFDN